MAFPDQTQPIASCAASSCTDCPVAEKIHCHFRPKDLLHFLLISFPGFMISTTFLYNYSTWTLGIYLAICLFFFFVLEIRVLCSHCPHYAEKGATLTCWANHGIPKIWKYRPGPMSTLDKSLFITGIMCVWGFPLPYMYMTESWFLLILYLLTNAAFFLTLKLFLCTKCMNFACPLNSVDKNSRELFLQRNPSVANHWLTHESDSLVKHGRVPDQS